jgi:dihydropteroate synthase
VGTPAHLVALPVGRGPPEAGEGERDGRKPAIDGANVYHRAPARSKQWILTFVRTRGFGAAKLEAYYPPLIAPVRTIGRKEFDFSRRIVVMGIVNRTPNSGLDPNRSMELADAVATADRAVREGAEWIDIGGRAFRADQRPLSTEEETARIVPAVKAVRERTDAVISIDTHLPQVAEAAWKAGADVVNDTNGLRSRGMVELIADTGLSVVITHSLGGPGKVVPQPRYGDVVSEVTDFLRSRVEYAVEHGVRPEKIIIDPGHDLNKNSIHSNELTLRLAEITRLGLPTLVATSNKHFIRESIDAEKGSAELRSGTIAANTLCAYQGARIVRVHDVAGNVAAMRAVEAVLGLTNHS